jgi:tRNA dimethylallyltransferase
MALRHGLFESPPVDPAIRAALEAEAAQVGSTELHRRLAEVDPKTAARLHPNDVRRVIRAWEVFQATGQPISAYQQSWRTATYEGSNTPSSGSYRIPCLVLDWPREVLYHRIESRVDQMLATGWLDEVRRLSGLGRNLSKEARQAVGYSELLVYLKEGRRWEETVTAIKTRTRQLAKRQLTWFRQLPDLKFVSADSKDLPTRIVSEWTRCDLG